MSEAKVNTSDYINFLIATSKHFSGLEASKVQPNLEHPPAQDSFNCLLYRLKPSAAPLWSEAKGSMNRQTGLLIFQVRPAHSNNSVALNDVSLGGRLCRDTTSTLL